MTPFTPRGECRPRSSLDIDRSKSNGLLDSGVLSASATCPGCGRLLPAAGSPCPACTLPSPGVTAPAPEAAAGLVAGRYLLQRRLGRGGAKDVWLAHDLTLDRPVALARMSRPSAWERRRREARLTARLGGHRHIVTVHDVFEDAGTPVLVARYMTGGSLADRGGLSVQEVIRAGREIADALAHSHAHGVVHRDVKPDNVWLDADGEAALGDFGVALADGEEAVSAAGTPLYAAPEQARGEAVSGRSDLYALGATLYELLCGRAPLAAGRLSGVVPPSRLVAGVPEALEEPLLSLPVRRPGGPPASPAPRRPARAPPPGCGRRSTPCSQPRPPPCRSPRRRAAWSAARPSS